MQKFILILSVIIFSQIGVAKKLSQTATTNDADLVKANKLQKRTHFIEATNLPVVQILPDDKKGLPHQKFVVRLTDGRHVTVVSNLKLCEKIPVEVNDVVSVGGEYIPTGKFGGILHWTHFDPDKKRPNGYIAMDNKLFCTSQK